MFFIACYTLMCNTLLNMDSQSCNCNKETCIKLLLITLDFTKMHRCDFTTLLSSYNSWFFFLASAWKQFFGLTYSHIPSLIRSQFLSGLIILFSSRGYYLLSLTGQWSQLDICWVIPEASRIIPEWLMLN